MEQPQSPETILEKALELTDSQERAAYLDEVCGKDAALRDEIESLLAAHFDADAFMNTLADPVWQETASEKEGDRIGRYKLLQQIGEGGFGTVYLAEQTEPVKRRVALKVIKAGMDSKEVIARFEAERQALALMDHPNIAKVHDAGTTEGGRPYFVMELVKGVPLTNYCADKDLETRERLDLFVDVCAAVQHAHQKGVIHRDLKPSNILVSPHDGKPVVKVIDFGIAKAISMELTDKTVFTQLGRMIGTPQYMSPEQAEINALDVDTRSDIYSLGVVLYDLLTGSTPLDQTKLRSAAYGEMQRMIREETPPKPSTRVSTVAGQVSTSHTPDSRSLRGDLDWIVMKALEKERERRYATANALAQDIGRHLRNEPVTAGPPSAVYRMRKFVRRNRRGLLSGAAAAMALLAGLSVAGGVWFKGRERVMRMEENAGNLIAEAEQLMAANAASPNFDDNSSFRRASELALRAEELLKGTGNEITAVRKRGERLMDAVQDEEHARVLITGIEEALMKAMSKIGSGKPDSSIEAAGLAKAFGDFGLNPFERSVEDTVERITKCRNPLQDRILVGLVAWAESLEEDEPGQTARLDEIIERADSDPWRRKLRQAIREEDRAALEAMVDSPDMKSQPTMTVLQLSTALEKEQLVGATVKLLRLAQQQAPESFWTNYTLGLTLAGAIDRKKDRDVRHKMFNAGSFNFSQGPVGMFQELDPVRPEFDEAIGFLRVAAAVRPDAEMARLFLGMTLAAGGRLDEAIATHRTTASRSPEAGILDLLIGSALLGQKRLEEAVPYLRSAAELDGASVLGQFQLGVSLAELGRYDEARTEMMKAVELREEELGDDSGETPDEAGFLHIMGMESDFDEPSVHLFLAMWRVMRDNGPESVSEALAECRSVLDSNPEDARAHALEGFILLKMGELEAARLALERAIRLGADTADIMNIYGMTLMQLGEAAKGLTYIEKASSLKPDDAVIQTNLGACFMSLGRTAEAETAVRRAVELNPGYPMAWNNLGAWYERQGDDEKAMESFRKANELDPSDLLSTGNLAQMLFRKEQYKESIPYYQRLNNAEDYKKLGMALMGKEMKAEAIDAFERALALMPDHPEALNNLALAYLKADRAAEALPVLEKVLASLQKDLEKDGHGGPTCLGDLADYYSMRGRPEEAFTLGEALLSRAREDHGKESPETLKAMQGMAGLHIKAGRLDEGFKMLEAMLAIRKRTPGAEDCVTLETMNRMATTYASAGRLNQAIDLQEEALAIIRRVLPQDQRLLLPAVEHLLQLRRVAGRDEGAFLLSEEALELSLAVRGKEDEKTLGNMTNFAIALYNDGRLDDAIALEEKALEIKRRVLPKDHPFLGNAMGLLADLYAEKGRIAEALALYEELLVLKRRESGPAHADTTKAMKHFLDACVQAERLPDGTKALSEHLEHLSRAGHGSDSEIQAKFRGALGELAGREATGLIQPEAIARYYEQNRDSFRNTSVHLHMITILREEGKDARATQRKEVEALRDKIVNGTPFAEIAKLHSADPYKDDGGDRGIVKRGQTLFDEHLEKAIFTMAPGTPTIHESEKLLWILKVEDRREGEPAPLEEVREQIFAILSKPLREKLLTEWIEGGRKAVTGEKPPEDK